MIVTEWENIVNKMVKTRSPKTMHYSLFMMLGNLHKGVQPCRRTIMDQLRDER